MINFDKQELQACTELSKNSLSYGGFVVILAWVYAYFGFSLWGGAVALFGLALLAISLIDLKYMIIPDILNLPLMVLGWVLLPWLLGWSWFEPLLGSAMGFLFFFAIFWGFYKFRGYYGMGFGDVKLLATLGAWVGAYNLVLVVLLSSIISIVIFALRRIFQGTATNKPMPYGPFLALAAWLSLFYSMSIWVTIVKWQSNLSDLIIRTFL